MADDIRDDRVQHGIDDSPTGDAEKGATLGGIGGAVTGAVAGAAAGPLGAVAGAVIGGVAGAAASGAAVAAVDRVDNDNTITGIGHGATTDVEDQLDRDDNTVYTTTGTTGMAGTTGAMRGGMTSGPAPVIDNGVPGVQTGGRANDGTPDTRGIMEKTADAVTGDPVDDKTGKVVKHPD